MKLSYFKTFFLLSLLSLASSLFAAGKEGHTAASPRLYLQTSLEKEKVVEGERVIYEVTLVSDTPDIAGFELLKYPDFSGLPSGQAAGDSHLKTIEKKGNTLYSVVVDRYFIGAEDVGKFQLKGGDYSIGINYPMTVNDPFWGPSVVNRVATFNLSAPDVELSISSLPSKGKPEDFSGAIGSFEISAFLRDKTLRVGDKGKLNVSVAGKGDLTNTPAPDVRAAFREGLIFRSMTDDKEHFITQGSLGSEMILDCLFTAETPGKFIIRPISFSFYNPEKKRYETIRTEPLEIEVLPAIEKEGPPPVYHNI